MSNNGRQSPARTPRTSITFCLGFPPYPLPTFGQLDNTSRVSVREEYWFNISTVPTGASIPLPRNPAATSPIFPPHPVSLPVTSGLQAPLPASTFRHFGLSFCSPIKVANRALGRMERSILPRRCRSNAICVFNFKHECRRDSHRGGVSDNDRNRSITKIFSVGRTQNGNSSVDDSATTVVQLDPSVVLCFVRTA